MSGSGSRSPIWSAPRCCTVRASCRAKNGLPADMSWIRRRSGLDRLRSSRSRIRRCSAPKLSGPTETTSSRSSNARSSASGTRATAIESPRKHEHQDPASPRPPAANASSAARRPVQPLDVVDRHDERGILVEPVQEADHTRCHGTVWQRPVSSAKKRHGQCIPLRRGKHVRDLVERRVEQIPERGERDLGLGSSRA